MPVEGYAILTRAVTGEWSASTWGQTAQAAARDYKKLADFYGHARVRVIEHGGGEVDPATLDILGSVDE